MLKTVKRFLSTYKHGFWILAYMIFYLLGFYILEHAGHRHYHVIHSVFDDMIPFCEYFIIPYVIWYPFWVFMLLYTAGFEVPGRA